jgi:hypothetical protein
MRAALPSVYAYVEWFTDPIYTGPTQHSGMPSVQRSTHQQAWRASIIPVSAIWRSCHLLPCLTTRKCPLTWTSDTVLDEVNRFFINSYLDSHMFYLLRYSRLLGNDE